VVAVTQQTQEQAATLLHTLEVLVAVQTVAVEVALAILLMVRLAT
jgi:hypothetical protein